MRYLVVDDHALIREALRGALRELDGEAEILEAGNGSEALRIIYQEGDIDLILLDLTLPDRDGFDVLNEIRSRRPETAVVVLSARQERSTVVKALDLGALGFIPKSTTHKVTLNALRLVMSGGIYIPPQALSPRDMHPGLSATDPVAAEAKPSPGELGLTQRQIDILAHMVRGKSNKAICRALNLAEPTVKNHVTAILRALKATSRTEAVVVVNEMKWELPPVIDR